MTIFHASLTQIIPLIDPAFVTCTELQLHKSAANNVGQTLRTLVGMHVELSILGTLWLRFQAFLIKNKS
jgi:hypothetical protein